MGLSEMAREQALLERISSYAERKSARYALTTEEDLDALMDSVRDNLRRLVNARHGMSQAQPDYGLPAFNDLSAEGDTYIKRVRDAIQATIAKYEPRLKNVRVSPQADGANPANLRFRVDATLIGATEECRISYETAVQAGGAIDVGD